MWLICFVRLLIYKVGTSAFSLNNPYPNWTPHWPARRVSTSRVVNIAAVVLIWQSNETTGAIRLHPLSFSAFSTDRLFGCSYLPFAPHCTLLKFSMATAAGEKAPTTKKKNEKKIAAKEEYKLLSNIMGVMNNLRRQVWVASYLFCEAHGCIVDVTLPCPGICMFFVLQCAQQGFVASCNHCVKTVVAYTFNGITVDMLKFTIFCMRLQALITCMCFFSCHLRCQCVALVLMCVAGCCCNDLMYTQGTLCDVILVVQGKHIMAHRVVLAAASHFFNLMFTSK